MEAVLTLLGAQNQSAQLQESTGCLLQGKYMSALQVSFCYREVRSLPPQSQTQVLCETEGSGREQCSSKKSCAESAQEQMKKRKRAPHAANAFWSLWIRDSGRSRAETLPGWFRQRRRRSWRPWSRRQIITKVRTQEKANLIPWVQEV